MLLANMTPSPMVNSLYLTLEYGHLLVVISYGGRQVKGKYQTPETVYSGKIWSLRTCILI